MKFIASLLIMNSHMSVCYEKFQFLSTGGGIGDSLFFFASGFLLFVGKPYRFDNWLKRRIQRIYPTIIAVSLLALLVFSQEISILDVLLCRRYWFVSCIMVYYVIFYPLLFFVDRLRYIFVCVFAVIVLIYFAFFDFNERGIFYGQNGFRQIFYFLFMIQGAVIGLKHETYRFKKRHVPCLIACSGFWYALLFVFNGNNWQILTVLPLLGITFYGYCVCCSPMLEKFYHSRYCGHIVYIVSALCLEIYVVQKLIISDCLNCIFPINIPVLMICIIFVAYALRILSNFIRQTFDSNPYCWNEMVKI